MHENLEDKLNHLGITSWKKRQVENKSLKARKMYIIDNDFLFLCGESDKNLTEKELKIFFSTLSSSLEKDEYRQITNFEEINTITHIFLLDEDLSKYPNISSNVDVYKMPSIKTVCTSKESKINFLNSIKGFIY